MARERSKARREHRFADADDLRARIEVEGWAIVDRGTETRLVRAHPLDLTDADGSTRYGWSGAVPLADGGAPTDVTLVVTARPEIAATTAVVARLADAAGPAGARILVVAGDDRPVDGLDTGTGADGGLGAGGSSDADAGPSYVRVLRVRGKVGPGTLVAVARRAIADGVMVIADIWPADAGANDIEALVAALGDPAVAVAGFSGRASADLRRFEESAPGVPVESVGWSGLACRIADARAIDDLDQRFADPEMFAAWWGLSLRDAGSSEGHRSAIGIRPAGGSVLREDQSTRKDRYRLIDRFGGRTDLLVERGGSPWTP